MTLYPTTHNAHKISVTTCHLPICGSSSKSPIYHSKRWSSSSSPLSAIDVGCSKYSSRTSISTHAMIWWSKNCTKKSRKRHTNDNCLVWQRSLCSTTKLMHEWHFIVFFFFFSVNFVFWKRFSIQHSCIVCPSPHHRFNFNVPFFCLVVSFGNRN